MTVMRIRYKHLHGYYYCRMFTAPGMDRTFAKVGDLIFAERDWHVVRSCMPGVEFIEDKTGNMKDENHVC